MSNTQEIVSLSIITLFVSIGFSIIIPALPLYAKSLGTTDTMLGLLITGFALSRTIVDFPAGVLTNKISPKRLIMIGLTLIIISSMVAGLANEYYLLLLMRIIEGIGMAFTTIASTTLLASALSEKSRGKSLGLYTSMILIGGIIGPLIGGFIVPIWGANSTFFAYALICFVSFFITIILVKELHKPQEKIIHFKWGKIIHDRSIIGVNITSLTFSFLYVGPMLTILPLYAYENLGLTPNIVGLIFGVSSVANLTSTMASGIITDKVGRKIPIIFSLILASLTVPLVAFTTSLEQLIITVAIISFASGFWGQTTAWATDLVKKEDISVAVGYNRMNHDIGFVIGPLAIGYISEITRNPLINSTPFVIASLIALLSVFLSVNARDPIKEKRNK